MAQSGAATSPTEQMADVRAAVEEVLASAPLPADAPIVVAGIGAPQIETLMQGLGRETLRFGTLANAAPDCAEWATRCAPAVAVALLAQ